MRKRGSRRLLAHHESLQGFLWISSMQQMIVNFSSSKVIHSAYPWLPHIISMQRGNGRTNYRGLQNLTSAQLSAAFPRLMGFSVGFHKVAFLINFFWSYGRSSSKARENSTTSQWKRNLRLQTRRARLCRYQLEEAYKSSYSAHLVFLTKQISAKYFLSAVLCTPPVFLIIPLLLLLLSLWLWKSSSSDSCLVCFPAFSKTPTISLPPSWHSINKSILMKLYQSWRFS